MTVLVSAHFTLDELVFSEAAARHGYDNTPDDGAFFQMKRLASEILEPLRVHLDRPVVVLSGYRNFQVNAEVSVNPKSYHLQGRAADIIVPGVSPADVCKTVAGLGLPFDELILEFGRWCHVAVAVDSDDPRREILTSTKRFGRTQYMTGIVA